MWEPEYCPPTPKWSMLSPLEPANTSLHVTKRPLQMRLSKDLRWEVILEYLGGPSVITNKREVGAMQLEEDWTSSCWL